MAAAVASSKVLSASSTRVERFLSNSLHYGHERATYVSDQDTDALLKRELDQTFHQGPNYRAWKARVRLLLTLEGRRADTAQVLPTRVPAPDHCHPLGRAGSVKVVFACTFTRQFYRCGCPAATDGLDGF
jgi:hypothetical protein